MHTFCSDDNLFVYSRESFQKINSLDNEELNRRIRKIMERSCGVGWRSVGFGWVARLIFKGLNYAEDLNLLHSIEELANTVDEHWAEKWLPAISLVLSDGRTDDDTCIGKWNIAHANARQRAQAFILASELK